MVEILTRFAFLSGTAQANVAVEIPGPAVLVGISLNFMSNSQADDDQWIIMVRMQNNSDTVAQNDDTLAVMGGRLNVSTMSVYESSVNQYFPCCKFIPKGGQSFYLIGAAVIAAWDCRAIFHHQRL